MLRSFKYRIWPNAAQDRALTGMLGAFCDLYNACLQQRIEAYQRRGISLRYGNQAAELKAVREADERLAGFSFSAEQQVLRRLDKAFSAFFGRIKRGGKAGFPRFRAASMFDSADFRVGDGLTIRQSKRVGLVGIPGEIKVRLAPRPANRRKDRCGCRQSVVRQVVYLLPGCAGRCRNPASGLRADRYRPRPNKPCRAVQWRNRHYAAAHAACVQAAASTATRVVPVQARQQAALEGEGAAGPA